MIVNNPTHFGDRLATLWAHAEKGIFNSLRYLYNLSQFFRYRLSPSYEDVTFDLRNGGLKCRSRRHFISNKESLERRYFLEENGGYTGHELELECQRILTAHGYMSVLEEDHIMNEEGNEKTSLDMRINGSKADVRSITVNGKHTLRNGVNCKNLQLIKYNRQNHCSHDTIIFHYHDVSLWDIDKITEALELVPTLVPRFLVRRVVCTINLKGATEDILKSINELQSPWFLLRKIKFMRLFHKLSPRKSSQGFLFERRISKKSNSSVVIVYLY